mgnify:FL=1
MAKIENIVKIMNQFTVKLSVEVHKYDIFYHPVRRPSAHRSWLVVFIERILSSNPDLPQYYLGT